MSIREKSYPTLTLAEPLDLGDAARRAAVVFEGTRLLVVAHGPAVDRGGLRRELARHLSAHVVLLDSRIPSGPAEIRFFGTPRGVRATVRVFPSVGRVTYSRARTMLVSLAADLGLVPEHLRPDRHVVLCLSEGSTGGEEILAAAMASADPGLPLVGATLQGARVEVEGTALAGGAAVVLLHSPVPLGTVFFHPWRPTSTRVVVTECEVGTRLVHRLDGRPARERLAHLTGDADPITSKRQLAWIVGGQVVARPVVAVHGDSLEVGGAVDRGTVLRLVAEVADPVGELLKQLERATASLPVPSAGAWLAADPGLVPKLRLSVAGKRASVIQSIAQQYGPIHTARAVAGILWGATG